ncbi:MAG: hypothetical protein AAGI23_09370 [Bacteroidota bacterium]
MNQTIISSSIDRANYRRALNFMKQRSPGQEFIITPADLRIEKLLSRNANKYSFDLYENQGSDRALEIKLNRNNLFFCTHIAICLAKQNGTSATGDGNHGNYPLFTYPDTQYFSGDDGASAKEFEALQTVYNGKLDVTTNPVVRMRDFSTNNFLYRPESQLLKQAGAQLEDELPQYGPSHGERGFYEVNPTIIFDGHENNSIELELGAGDKTLIAGEVNNANAAVPTRNVVVLLLKGFVVENGAQKVGRWTAF